MYCPNCDFKTDEKICPNCETDILQYCLIDKMSFDAYNKGLTLAKQNDISGAIVELEKAVSYNNSNITALNLLGLCYDKIGRVADASKYWIKSCLVIEENIAKNYLNVVEERVSKREQINESIKMYNQALVYSQQKNFDIAIIQLKSAIDKNGTFVEALNLLALVYITQGEKEKAIGLLKRVLKIDVKNEKALYYLESLNYKFPSSRTINRKDKESVKVTRTEIKKSTEKNKLMTKQSFTAFGLGLLVMLVIYIVLVIPNIETGFQNSSILSEKSYKEQLEQQSIIITANETELTKLRDENETLKAENETLKDDYATLNVYVNLINAQEYLDVKDYKTAAACIFEIDETKVLPEQIDTYNSLKKTIYPLASKSYYDTGITKYGQGKYEEAIDDFELSYRYGGTDKDYYPNSLFYIGRCYEGLGNNTKAKEYYQKIIDEYPNNDTVYSAKSRLNSISQ